MSIIDFFSIECTVNDDVISVSVARNSRDLTSLNLIPAPHKRYSYMLSKTLLDVNTSTRSKEVAIFFTIFVLHNIHFIEE